LEIQEKRHIYRNVSFKTLELGEIIGHLEAYHKVNNHR